MLLLAEVNWTAVGVIGGVIVSLASTVLVYVKGRKADAAVESSSMINTAFEGQKTLVRDLQEEVSRHREIAMQCEAETASLRVELNAAKSKIADLEREVIMVERENLKHQKKIQDLESEVMSLRRINDERTS